MGAGPTVKPLACRWQVRCGRPRHSRQAAGRCAAVPRGNLFPRDPPSPPLPPVPYLPAPAPRRGRARHAARLLLTEPFSKPSPAALCALETLHHGDAPRRAALGGMCGGVCVRVTPNPVPPIGGIACAPLSGKRSGVLLGGRLSPPCHSSRATLSSRAGRASRLSPPPAAPPPPCTLEKDTMVWRSIRTSTHSLILLLPRRDPAETGSKDGEWGWWYWWWWWWWW